MYIYICIHNHMYKGDRESKRQREECIHCFKSAYTQTS